jgi:NADH-quinone oxidoreductase subunit N
MLGDLVELAPLWIVAVLGLVVLMLDVFIDRKSPKAFVGYFSAAGLGVALVVTLMQLSEGGATLSHPFVATKLAADAYALFGHAVILITGIFVLLSAVHYLPEQKCEWGEFYSLTIFSIFGMMVMVSATELMTLFVGLEIMSLAVYILAGFKRHSAFCVEASMKYFFLGAFATGFLLYGIAFVYGDTGTTELARLHAHYANTPPTGYGIIVLLMMVVAFGFKVAAVPFHMWTPDVYEGAPSPVTALMAAGVKTASFLALARLFVGVFDQESWSTLAITWERIFFWLAIATMTVGNVLALVQRSVKRMLAYSSVAHAGYLLIAVLAVQGPAGSAEVGSGLLFYLLGYSLATVGAFAVISMLGKDMVEDITFAHFSGLGFRSPAAAAAMSVCVLSLAGIPPTAGFLGKYLVFQQVLTTNMELYLPLVVIAVLNSVVSVYYYLKVLVYMYMRPERDDVGIIDSMPMRATYVLSALAVLAAGTLPGTLLQWSQRAASSSTATALVVVDKTLPSPVAALPELLSPPATVTLSAAPAPAQTTAH